MSRVHRVIIALISLFMLVPALAHGQPQSPVTGIESGDRFAALAGMVPDHLGSDWDGMAHYAYADLAGQADALGLTAPEPAEAGTSDWMWAVDGLPLLYLDYLTFADEWGPAFGFDMVSVEQTLTFNGEWEESFVLWHGDFDAQRITDALSDTGYHTETHAGVEYWLFHEEMHIDFESPVGMFGTGQMNVAVVLDERTVAFSGSQDSIEAIIDAHSGTAPTLADNEDVQDVLDTARPDLVSMVLMSGKELALEESMYQQVMYMDVDRSLEEDLAGLDAEHGPLATASVVLVGESAGGPVTDPDVTGGTSLVIPDGVPAYRIQLVLAFKDNVDAEAAGKIIPARIELMSEMASLRPYTDYISVESSGVSPSGTLAVIDITPIDRGHGWMYYGLLGRSVRFLFITEDAVS